MYAPIADKDNGEVESFYRHVDDVMKLTGSKDVTLLLGHMNAKIGQGHVINGLGSTYWADVIKEGTALYNSVKKIP